MDLLQVDPQENSLATGPTRRSGAKLWTILIGSAAMLAVTALIVRRQARQAERANPPLGRFVEVDGVRLHYLEQGQGEPLVLLHGNGSMIQDFLVSGLIDDASRRYRVIVFDRPGFGYSERPRGRIWTPNAQAKLLHKALRGLGVERAIVVGHSWGTLVALALALEHPESVRSLVLLSGYYFPNVRLDVPLLAPPAFPVIGDVMRYTISPVLGRLLMPIILRKLFAPAPVPARFDGFPTDLTIRPSHIRASAAETGLMIPAVFALRRRYGELQMPILIMAGMDDRLIDAEEQSGRLHRMLPGSELRLAPVTGHMVHQSVPEQVMAAIDRVALPVAAGP